MPSNSILMVPQSANSALDRTLRRATASVGRVAQFLVLEVYYPETVWNGDNSLLAKFEQ
jgi:hypothetical protein